MWHYVPKIKKFVEDFNAVGDDATDNYPAALQAVGHMAWGGHVESGPGVFRVSDWPEMNMCNGGFHGAGPGGNLPNYTTGALGTVVRHTVDADFWKFGSGARDLEFSGFALQPVLKKTGTNAEIVFKDRSNTIHFKKIRGNYPNVFARNEGGVHHIMEDAHIFAPSGSSGWYAKGAPSGNRSEGLTLVRCTSYTPHKVNLAPEANNLKDYAATTVWTTGWWTFAGGWLLQCTQGGTRGASFPGVPAFTNAADHTGSEIIDGGVKWNAVCKADYAAVDADTKGDYFTLLLCRLLQGVHAVRMRNSLSTNPADRPKEMLIYGGQWDHNAGNSCQIEECASFQFDGRIDSTRGYGIWFGSGTARRMVNPSRIANCDLGQIGTQDAWPWKADDCILGMTPLDGVLMRGPQGDFQLDFFNTDARNMIWRSRDPSTGAILQQWSDRILPNGDMLRRDDTGPNVAQYPFAKA